LRRGTCRGEMTSPAAGRSKTIRVRSPPMRDTSQRGDERYHELLRARLPHERLATAMSLSRGVRALAEAGIRSRYPDADETEVKMRLVVRLYGRAAAVRLFGAVPEDAI
jgi:hypothetical protein